MLYFAYLDEFGHIGPFLSRTDAKHKTSPVFGLGGIVLPYPEVRNFSMFFHKLKQDLLRPEIEAKGKDVHPANWEKKGSSLYTVRNVEKYQELRGATNRLLNKLKSVGGFVFYTGIEKDPPSAKHVPEQLYLSVLADAIRRLNNFCEKQSAESKFCVVLDAVDSNDESQKKNFRPKSVIKASKSMFGSDRSLHLLEPPFHVESYLNQNMQCADWMCGLVGRLAVYQVRKDAYPDFEIFDKYFHDRMKSISPFSALRKKNPCCRIISLPLDR